VLGLMSDKCVWLSSDGSSPNISASMTTMMASKWHKLPLACSFILKEATPAPNQSPIVIRESGISNFQGPYRPIVAQFCSSYEIEVWT